MNLTERQVRKMRMCDLNPSYIQNVKWNYFKEIDYKPHKGGQRDYHLSEARFRIIAAGTRWGKSMGAGNEYAGFMMVAPFPFRFWIVAPSYDLGAKEFEYGRAYRNIESTHQKTKLECTFWQYGYRN